MKIVEINEFELVRNQWNTLLSGTATDGSVFSTWEWLSTWWKHFGRDKKLLLLLVQEGSRLLGAAPLMLTNYRLPALGKIKKIEFVGSPHTDYHSFLLVDMERECVKLIADYLIKHVPSWDLIELRHVPEVTATAKVLASPALADSDDFKMRNRVCSVCPFIQIPESFSSFMSGLPFNFRRNLKKSARRLNKEHRVELRRYDEMGVTLKAAIDGLVEQHEARRAAEGLTGLFKKYGNAFRDFHMDVAASFAERGWLGLYFLTANGEPISSVYGFEYGRKMYDYLDGFNPAYSRYSVGNIAKMLVLQRLINEGFREYDFLRGGESYKLRWTSSFRRNFETRLVRRKLRSVLYDIATSKYVLNEFMEKLGESLNHGSS